MFDIQLRSLKDKIFDPLCQHVPTRITPLHITIGAFLCGVFSCIAASQARVLLSLCFWFLNRGLDCLDGALARHRNTASDLGGFLDLLGDFVIYSLIPIGVATGWSGSYQSWRSVAGWRAVACLEATFHVNNFILFYVAAVAEKRQSNSPAHAKTKELTSVMMRPALIEGMESGVLFTMMLAVPSFITQWCWLMAGLVGVGIAQRSLWVVRALQ